jgi:hypothetical protein
MEVRLRSSRRKTRLRRVLMLVALCSALASCGAEALPRTTGSTDTKQAGSTTGRAAGGRAKAQFANAKHHGLGGFRFFSHNSFWNQLLPAKVALDPNSAELVGQLAADAAAEVQARKGPWIDTTSYSVPIYTVPANEPTVRVRLVGLREPALQRAWNYVPLPANAQPSLGTDAELVVWQPSRNRMWEFWRLGQEAGAWHASWGGVMRKVSSNDGVYSRRAWPGAKPWWGASATSLPLAGGLITLEDMRRHEVDHALAVALPETRAGVFADPAQRSDGISTNRLALPEGARLRLDPKLDIAGLHLSPVVAMIARAAQRYGLVVRDKGGNVAFFGQDPITTGSDPYAGAGGYFEGKYPYQLLASFPWSSLQVVGLHLRRTRTHPHPQAGGGLSFARAGTAK